MDEDSANTAPSVARKKRHRWYQFSLRSLLVLTTIVGLICGFVVRPALEQQRIVNELSECGATVGYDHADCFLEFVLNLKESWFDRLVGLHFLHTATGVWPGYGPIGKSLGLAARLPGLETVDLTGCDVSDNDLAELRGAKRLKRLRLNLMGSFFTMGAWRQAQGRDPDLCDSGLTHLENLTGLETLSFDGRSCANDAGFAHFAKLTSLRSLNLVGSSVTGLGLSKLNCQDTLEELDLFCCPNVNDADMRIVARFKHLRRLNLGETKVTDRGLAELQCLSVLAELDLQDCHVTDAGLTSVGKLTLLRTLSLYGTKVSDAGLRQLEPIRELDKINLHDTAVTREGVEEVANHLRVGEWAISQDWRERVRVPKGQRVYGVPAPHRE